MYDFRRPTPKQIEATRRNHRIRQLRMMHSIKNLVLDLDLREIVHKALDEQLIRLSARTDKEQHDYIMGDLKNV